MCLPLVFIQSLFLIAFGEYILMSPSDAYEPFMATVWEKIHLSKVTIEFLSNNPEATYEDLLNKLQTSVPLQGIVTSFTEDALLRHAQWLVDQVGII